MAFEYDYHVHTTLSFCHEGDLTVDNLIKKAQERGLEGFAVTDHSSHLYFDRPTVSRHEYLVNYDVFLEGREHGNRQFEKYLNMLEGYRTANVLTGAEVDVSANGELIFDSRYRDRVDVLLGGIHWLPCMAGDFDGKTFLAEFMDFTMMLLESDIDVLVHPTRILRKRKLGVPGYIIAPIVQQAKKNGIAIEINSHTQRDPYGMFIQPCIDAGVKLAMGTDTHNIMEMGDFSYHRELLERHGVREEEMDSIMFKHNGL